MQKQAKEIQYFFYSQAFADGFRASFAILLPSLIGSYIGYFDIGLTISLGAMCVSLSDAPGPFIHKKNGMLFCSGFIFLVAILTSIFQQNIYAMGLEIALVSFFFSMLNVYGNRAAAVGSAAILVMILTMDTPVEHSKILLHALLLFAGGIFYTLISLLLYTIRPYRVAQRALGDCIREIANYLSLKADFYNTDTELDLNYKKLIAQQIAVNEKQDAVREVFFKTRQIVEESTGEGRKLLFSFVETVDLFEDITAAYYDYALLRKKFSDTGALDLISHSLKKIASEVNAVGFAIQGQTSFTKSFDYDEELKQLKSKIDIIAFKDRSGTLILRKILVNLRKILNDLNNVIDYFDNDSKKKKTSLDHTHFVTHQSLNPRIFWDNLSLRSSVFKHALRVCIACVAGFVIAKLIFYGHHSYWILMTIAFMLKPAFSLTRQRNIERIIGTFAGGIIGVAILYFIPDKTIQFLFMVVFMIGTYSFIRIRYLVTVICITPYILILFSFLGAAFKSVAEERILDTVLGCAIAFLASYFLFPSWESHQLKNYMKDMLKANVVYLQKIIEALSGQKVNMLEYKLARKNVYLNSANLSAAFQRMLSEPKNKQKAEKDIHQFVVLNHILFSNSATVATTLLSRNVRTYPAELIHLAKKTVATLNESSKKLGDAIPVETLKKEPVYSNETEGNADDLLMKEQLNFICKVSTDIDKTINAII